MKTHYNKKEKRPVVDYELTSPSLLDSNEFKAYTKLVERAVRDAGKAGATIGDIHRSLGPDTRREWTLDALSYLSVEEIDQYISRYRVRAVRPGVKRDWMGNAV